MTSRTFLRPALAALAAQIGSSTDIITGIISGPDGRPLAGARVEATSVEATSPPPRTPSRDGSGSATPGPPVSPGDPR